MQFCLLQPLGRPHKAAHWLTASKKDPTAAAQLQSYELPLWEDPTVAERLQSYALPARVWCLAACRSLSEERGDPTPPMKIVKALSGKLPRKGRL